MKALLLFFSISSLTVAIFSLNLFSYLQSQHNPYLVVDFLSVGQGDAALVSFPGSQQLLIDAGADKNFLRSLSSDLNFFDRKIDYLLITHAHDDHFGGAVELIRRYRISQIFISNYNSTDAGYDYLLKEANSFNIPVFKVTTTTGMAIGGVNLQLIAPLEKQKNTNNQSLLVFISYGVNSFLFMGDTEADAEKKLILPEAQILKAGHHGSKTSSSDYLLSMVKPQVAVISVGDNKFGHPSPETIKQLLKLGISVWRTDEQENIRFQSNGQILQNKGKK